MTDSSRHTLLLPALHSQWSRQVYIIHESITGFLVVQEPTCTHAHEYKLLGASCSFIHCHSFIHSFIHSFFCHEVGKTFDTNFASFYTKMDVLSQIYHWAQHSDSMEYVQAVGLDLNKLKDRDAN